MTQKEIDKFLADTKVYVAGKSKEIQEKLFSLGYKWADGRTDVHYTEDPFLFIYRDMYFRWGNHMVHFCDHENREISADEIRSLERTEPAYRPFQNKDECWNEMLKHEPFGWSKHKEKQIYKNWICVDSNLIDGTSFYDAYKHYTFTDGTPFGIKDE